MKKTNIIFLLLFCTPISLNASYLEAMKKRANSATFHAIGLCFQLTGKISSDQFRSMSKKHRNENFKKSELKLLDQSHWDAAKFLAYKIKEKNCKRNYPEFDEDSKLFTDILLRDY